MTTCFRMRSGHSLSLLSRLMNVHLRCCSTLQLGLHKPIKNCRLLGSSALLRLYPQMTCDDQSFEFRTTIKLYCSTFIHYCVTILNTVFRIRIRSETLQWRDMNCSVSHFSRIMIAVGTFISLKCYKIISAKVDWGRMPPERGNSATL